MYPHNIKDYDVLQVKGLQFAKLEDGHITLKELTASATKQEIVTINHIIAVMRSRFNSGKPAPLSHAYGRGYFK
jgi:hypothetical protein